MSSSNTSGINEVQSTSTLEPPQAMRRDDPAAADPARRRLAQKSRFPLFSSLPNLRSHHDAAKRNKSLGQADHSADNLHHTDSGLHPLEQTNDNDTIISLDHGALPDAPEDRDVYRWAVMYENQRGITVFSTPYYSRLSLLPSDPLPFTVPSKSNKRSHQPNVSLTNYPLPDGTWKWVSKSWMIDMRTDSGEVQHDGFEYNWVFRDHSWRADIGKLSAGAWVRRRRWVRMMMRPAKKAEPNVRGSTSPPSRPSFGPSTSFVSLVHPASEFALDVLDQEGELVFDGSDQDWIRCHRLLRRLGRDGRKLELWKKWLGPLALPAPESDVKGKQTNKQWAEDEELLPSEVLREPERQGGSETSLPARGHLAAIFRNHGETILRSFVFPDSRAKFLALVRHTGLLGDLEAGLHPGASTSEVDFWSYASGLDKVLDGKQGKRHEDLAQLGVADGHPNGEVLAKDFADELEKEDERQH
ncbi:hypothetical protein BV22DRAFT_1053566 [Leucogyrophana mollusca]|uniref:Uncharacterized protein n=1 Tax=Leucogyrophana mollusca TaxID=85980 RepID=A0ACB8BZ44_9AGAM|nr:hypothetical protein BV22DRAFT_1053566 [Leucogyrophana mollusca]